MIRSFQKKPAVSVKTDDSSSHRPRKTLKKELASFMAGLSSMKYASRAEVKLEGNFLYSRLHSVLFGFGATHLIVYRPSRNSLIFSSACACGGVLRYSEEDSDVRCRTCGKRDREWREEMLAATLILKNGRPVPDPRLEEEVSELLTKELERAFDPLTASLALSELQDVLECLYTDLQRAET